MTEPGAERVSNVDLLEIARSGLSRKPAWASACEDLNVNLVVLTVGSDVAEHINNEVDVLIVGIDGDGIVAVDGQEVAIAAGRLVIVPKGARRAMRPSGERFAYLTCHRRCAGLWPTGTRNPQMSSGEGAQESE